MIYVISAIGISHVKVGVARNPVSRLRKLQTGQPLKLVILALADWPNQSERRIHRVLRAERVRGEWFVRCDKIARLISHMQRCDTGPEQWLETLSTPARLARILRIAR